MYSTPRVLRLGRVRYRQSKVVREHRHNFYHFIYVLDGKGLAVLNGEIHHLNPGDVHVYHPEWSHDVWAQPRTRFETLDLRFLISDVRTVELAKALPAFIPAGSRAEQLRNIVREIELLGLRRKNVLWREAANAYLTILLSMLLDPQQQANTYAMTSEDVSTTALNLMVSSLPGGISVARLADLVFMSPTHLTTVFKSRFGKSVQELMIQLKIDYAKQILATNPTIKIGRLAKKLDWRDPRRFRQHFKDLTGMTPSEFARCYSAHQISRSTNENWLVFSDDTSGKSEFMSYLSKSGKVMTYNSDV